MTAEMKAKWDKYGGLTDEETKARIEKLLAESDDPESRKVSLPQTDCVRVGDEAPDAEAPLFFLGGDSGEEERSLSMGALLDEIHAQGKVALLNFGSVGTVYVCVCV